MPYAGYSIGQGIAEAGRGIASGLTAKYERDEKERRRKAERDAILREAGIGPNDPLYKQAANMDTEAINSALRQRKAKADREAQEAADAFYKQSEDTINVSSQLADNPQATAPVFGKSMPLAASPLSSKANRLKEIQSGTPAITSDERASVLRSEMRPGDEGLAGVAARSRSMAGERQSVVDEKEAEAAWEQFQSSNQSMDAGALGKMGLAAGDRLKYAGQTPQQIQQRAREGQPSEGPQWSKEDQQVVLLLNQQGLREGTPEFAQAFVDQKKRGGVTATQERADAKEIAFAEIEKRSYQEAPQHMMSGDPMLAAAENVDLKAENEKARKQWMLGQKIKWMKENARSTGDPLDALKAQLGQELEALQAELNDLLSQ